MGLHHVDHLIHHFRRLSNGKAADGKAIAVDFRDFLHMPGPEIREGSSLVDAKEHLMGIYRIVQTVEAVMLGLAAFQPAQRPLAGGLCIFVGGGVFHAFVKSHGDVAAQVGLDLHGLLRAHENLPPVNMGGKIDALLLDLAQGRKREHLESAGVRQDRAIPVHKLMEPSHLTHQLITGPQVEVVSVGKFDLTAHFPQIVGGDTALDGGLGADIHENRRLHDAAVRAGKLAPAGASLGLDYSKHRILLSKNCFSIII